MFMRPEFTSRPDPSLNFVDYKVGSVFLCQRAELAEVGGGGVFVPSLGEDRLDYDCCDW